MKGGARVNRALCVEEFARVNRALCAEEFMHGVNCVLDGGMRMSVFRKLLWILVVIGILFGIVWVVYRGKVAADDRDEDGLFEQGTVLYVIDGDTVDVSLDGEKVRVRMIGINTPEGDEASKYVKGLLPEGTRVYLEYDEERTDRYGRTLAYLWTSNQLDTNSFEDFCKYNVGAVVMQHTYCEAMYVKPNGKYYDWYKQLEDEKQAKPAA